MVNSTAMDYHNFILIVQARTRSTRLPRKIVRPVDGEQTFLHIILRRLQQLQDNLSIVVATSTHGDDDIVEKISHESGLPVFRGSELNVLERFIETARAHHKSHIIRVCSDNPFIDINSLKHLLQVYGGEDYLSYNVNGQPAILTHYGFFAEVVTLSALIDASTSAGKSCIEHVTNCIYNQPGKYRIRLIPLSISNQSIRCTLDTPTDFNTLQRIYLDWFAQSATTTYKDVIAYIESQPAILEQMQSQIEKNQK
jgi:spore coat polysaccharide biosynthesis protein SpsF